MTLNVSNQNTPCEQAPDMVLVVHDGGLDSDVLPPRILRFPGHSFVRIGRGYDCDIVLLDPFVSALELEIKGWRATAPTAKGNGWQKNGVAQTSSSLDIVSGDVLRVGRSDIAFFTPDHPVAAVRMLKKSQWSTTFFSNLLFVLAALASALWSYLEIWNDDPEWTALVSGFSTVVIILFWAAAWSVGGRMARRGGAFQRHAGLVSLYVLAALLLSVLLGGIDFLLSENAISLLLGYAAHAVLIGVLIHRSLALASHMSARQRWLNSTLGAVIFVAVIFFTSYIDRQRFNPAPPYAFLIEPYIGRFTTGVTPEEFMKKSDAVFSDPLLEKR